MNVLRENGWLMMIISEKQKTKEQTIENGDWIEMDEGRKETYQARK